MSHLYSNEIVFRGHPDKVCDQISGAILAAAMRQDKKTRAGIEVVGGKGKIFITGEVTTKAILDVDVIARNVLRRVGYDESKYEVIDNLGKQSHDISIGVNVGGAGDQGMMFGYACDDTKELLPKAMVILQKFSMFYDKLRQEQPDVFYPDGKAQITGEYNEHRKLIKIKTFLCSYQNCETKRDYSDKVLKQEILRLCSEYKVKCESILFNPTGKFKIGGFDGDAGLTGRKIVVDAYQSFANVGGGCMNGKDPTKVDFSAAHMARDIAKSYLKKYKLKWCEVQLSYAIGKPEPLAIYIEGDRGNIVPPKALYRNCSVRKINETLKLEQADFERLAMFGHFTD